MKPRYVAAIITSPTGNLPSWPGATVCYARAYKLLDWMGKNGHIKQQKARGKTYCTVSDEMNQLIASMNKGDEEGVKYFLSHPDYINAVHDAEAEAVQLATALTHGARKYDDHRFLSSETP